MNAVSVFRRLSTRYLNIMLPIFLRYCGIGYPPRPPPKQLVSSPFPTRRLADTSWLNSVVNPVLYCYRDHCFRKAVLGFLKIGKTHATQKTDVGVRRFCRQNSQPGQHCLPNNVQHEGEHELKNVKKPSRWRRSDPRCSTTDFAGANVMMLKKAIHFSTISQVWLWLWGRRKSIYQHTIGIIYEVSTSSSDNPLTKKRSVFSVRPRRSQNSLLAVVPSPFTCVDYGGCYGV